MLPIPRKVCTPALEALVLIELFEGVSLSRKVEIQTFLALWGIPYCYAGVRQNVSCKIGPFLALFYTCLAGSKPYVYRKW